MIQAKKRRAGSHKKLVSFSKIRKLQVAGVVALFAVTGVALINFSSAATYGASSEAENATLAGNAAKQAESNASGGASVVFGAAIPEAPTNLVSFVGGSDLAIRWDTSINSVASNRTVLQYDVYRDGVKIASALPKTSFQVIDTKGRVYIDKQVVRNKKYVYQVAVVDSANTSSALSRPLEVTIPTNASPAVTVSADTSGAQDLATLTNNDIVPFVKTWYPKIVENIAKGQLNSPTDIKIRYSTKNLNGISVNLWNTASYSPAVITFNPDKFRNDTYKPGVVAAALSAATGNDGKTAIAYGGWAEDGLRCWSDQIMMRGSGIDTFSNAGFKYNQGCLYSSRFLEWVRVNKDPGILQKINKAIATNSYSDNLIQNYTGKTIAQLQAEWQPSKGPSLVKFSAYANKCLDNNLDGGKTDYRIQIWDCNGTEPQQWYAFYQPDGTFVLRSANSCLATATTAPKSVGMTNCAPYKNFLWRQDDKGRLVSVVTDKCLETPGGNTTTGTWLDLAACGDGPQQKFTAVPK